MNRESGKLGQLAVLAVSPLLLVGACDLAQRGVREAEAAIEPPTLGIVFDLTDDDDDDGWTEAEPSEKVQTMDVADIVSRDFPVLWQMPEEP